MILYNPIDGDVYSRRIRYKPRTCFLMTKIGKPIPKEVTNMRRNLKKHLKIEGMEIIDASSKITGKDFLLKIFDLIASVPLGIALMSNQFQPSTIANIFYEIGLLQGLGKEVLIVKTEDFKIPSDFVRTEYIEYNNKFKNSIKEFISTFLHQAEHYEFLGDELRKNPIISINYYNRAYLMTGEKIIRKKLSDALAALFNSSTFDSETKENIKALLSS